MGAGLGQIIKEGDSKESVIHKLKWNANNYGRANSIYEPLKNVSEYLNLSLGQKKIIDDYNIDMAEIHEVMKKEFEKRKQETKRHFQDLIYECNTNGENCDDVNKISIENYNLATINDEFNGEVYEIQNKLQSMLDSGNTKGTLLYMSELDIKCNMTILYKSKKSHYGFTFLSGENIGGNFLLSTSSNLFKGKFKAE